MSNPYSVYKANYIDNLPLGVTYNSTIARFFYNGKSFFTPQAVESYRLYLNKVFDPLSFDPLVLWDFSEGTVFQDVNGTTPATQHGDPVGLVLDRSQGLARGSEEVTNGDFSDGANDWTLDPAFSVVGDTLVGTATGGVTEAALQSVPTVNGDWYELTIDVASVVGNDVLLNVGASFNRSITSSGTFSYIFKSTAANSTLQLRFASSATAGDTISINSFSLKQIPGNHLRQPTDNLRPTLDIVNGVRGIRFNGTDQFLDATGLTAASGPKTVIAVCITDDGETRGLQFLLDAQNGRSVYAASRNVAGSAGINDGSWSTGGAYDSESLAVLAFKHYASDGGIRINGATSVTENFTENAYGGSVAVGSKFDGALSFLKGGVHAMMIEDRALSDREIQLYESFVANKQGRSL